MKAFITNKPDSLTCPVDFVTVDENRARLVAFFVLIFAVLFLVSHNPVIIGLLIVDFVMRALNLNAYSPLALLSGVVLKQSGIKPKLVDRAPKRFAAFVGIAFLAGILALSLLLQTTISAVATSVLILFAALESFLGFCIGCHVYTFLLRFTGK